jgi:small subunit ribosomal protein S16e
VYAIRQAISKSIALYLNTFFDAESSRNFTAIFKLIDRSFLTSDQRRSESKKFGGRGARSRFQKSYR